MGVSLNSEGTRLNLSFDYSDRKFDVIIILVITYTLITHIQQQPHRPLARYAKLRVAHVPGMPGTFSPPPRVSDPDMHHDTCVTHVPWCILGSLTNGFLWSRWRGKRSRHSRRMRNPQFCISDKRPIGDYNAWHLKKIHLITPDRRRFRWSNCVIHNDRH